MGKFDEAKMRLPDGRIVYDCVKLAAIKTEGIILADYPRHLIVVETRNTVYEFAHVNGRALGQATRKDNPHIRPRFLAEPTLVSIHGSTFGGSIIKVGYVGVEMHLEFHELDAPESGRITTSAIENVRVSALEIIPTRLAA